MGGLGHFGRMLIHAWILVISQENLDVSRMMENGHGGLRMRQQTDPLPGTSSRRKAIRALTGRVPSSLSQAGED